MFIWGRKVGLIVDSDRCEAVEVAMGVPQESPIPLILFILHLSEIYKEVEDEVEECMATLFPDDCRWLIMADSVAQLYEQLE